MDAFTHAMEGYITAGAWELSICSTEGNRDYFPEAFANAVANTPEGRADGFGQYVAGMGWILMVVFGIVHSMAHPLEFYDTPHGVANAIILPTVMEYNAPATGEKYRRLQEQWAYRVLTA